MFVKIEKKSSSYKICLRFLSAYATKFFYVWVSIKQSNNIGYLQNVSSNLSITGVFPWWWCASPRSPRLVCALSERSAMAACTSVRTPSCATTTLWTGLSCSGGVGYESTASTATGPWRNVVRSAAWVFFNLTWFNWEQNVCAFVLILLTELLQLLRVMCVTRCVQAPVAGARDPTSVSSAGTTAEMAHVWTAVILMLGQYTIYSIHFCTPKTFGIFALGWNFMVNSTHYLFQCTWKCSNAF